VRPEATAAKPLTPNRTKRRRVRLPLGAKLLVRMGAMVADFAAIFVKVQAQAVQHL